MKHNKSSLHLLFLFLFCVISNKKVTSQSALYPLSFKANQNRYKDSYCKYYYHIQKEGNQYRLIDPKQRNVLQKTYDTIVYNASFIKAICGDSMSIYRSPTLEEIKISNSQQIYLIRDGLEVLTESGPQYYNNSVTKINDFPKLDNFACGNVYSKEYRLHYNEKTKKHSVVVSEGHFGSFQNKTTLELEDLPDNIKRISFLNDDKYVTQNINNRYNEYPNLLKIVKEGKSGIYSYTIDKAVYPKTKKERDYIVNKKSGDTIFAPVALESIFFVRKGRIKLEKVLPIDYDLIHRDLNDGLIYLYQGKLIGIYPRHKTTSFEVFQKKTVSFYEITKNGKKGWLDIRTFKEYFF